MALVSELDLGNVPLVKIRNCPVPVDPLTSVFSAVGLNVTHIETLQIQYVPRDNTESLQGMRIQFFALLSSSGPGPSTISISNVKTQKRTRADVKI